jgi:hypothetical protein
MFCRSHGTSVEAKRSATIELVEKRSGGVRSPYPTKCYLVGYAARQYMMHMRVP